MNDATNGDLMGTNYYWRDQICTHCGRYNSVHVGKKKMGWSFGFRAWPHQLFNKEYPDWGYDPESPFGFPVLSRADWRAVFTSRPGELRNESDDLVDDPVAWIDGLEPPTEDQKAREDSMRASPLWRPEPGEEWRDAEGFHFWAREFS